MLHINSNILFDFCVKNEEIKNKIIFLIEDSFLKDYTKDDCINLIEKLEKQKTKFENSLNLLINTLHKNIKQNELLPYEDLNKELKSDLIGNRTGFKYVKYINTDRYRVEDVYYKENEIYIVQIIELLTNQKYLIDLSDEYVNYTNEFKN